MLHVDSSLPLWDGVQWYQSGATSVTLCQALICTASTRLASNQWVQRPIKSVAPAFRMQGKSGAPRLDHNAVRA